MRIAIVVTVAWSLALSIAPTADATVRSEFFDGGPQPGTLYVASDGADAIVVACAGGEVLVNGKPPDTGPVPCGRTGSIVALGGPGDNRIDLGGIRLANAPYFKGLSASARVEGGGGDDSIVGPHGALVTLVGGPGDDRLEGHADSVDAYVFEPAGAPERDTIVEPPAARCDPSYAETHWPDVSWWTVPWDSVDFTALPADDPVHADGRGPGGVFASHRNRTVSIAGPPGTRFEAIAGGAGDDRISWACMLLGGGGADTLTGTSFGDLLAGGSGDDVLIGGAGTDKLAGGDGADELSGGDGGDALDGGPGTDALRGWNGSDVYLFNGRDGTQTDVVDEDAGRGALDVLSFDLGPASPVSVDLSAPSKVLARAAGLEVRTDFRSEAELEGAIGGAGDDVLLGNERANHFWSGGGTDFAAGRRGNDIYHVDWTASMPYAAYFWDEYWSAPFERVQVGRPDGGPQSILRIEERAGGGFDTVDVAERWISSSYSGNRLSGQISAGVRIDLGAPRWIVRTSSVGALTAQVGGARHLEGIRGTAYRDVILGNAAANVLEGRQGRDRVFGRAGRDACLTARDGDQIGGCEAVRRANPDR